MTGTAILRDARLLTGCGVRSVMASETAGEIGMPEVVGVRALGDLQVGKYVAVVDGRDLSAGGGDIVCPL